MTIDTSAWLRINNADGDTVFNALHWGGDMGWDCVTPDGNVDKVDTKLEMFLNALIVWNDTMFASATGYFSGEFMEFTYDEEIRKK